MTTTPDLLPPRFNMAAYAIGRAASRRATAPALIVIDDVSAAQPAELWTFAAIEDAVLRIAGGLRQAGLRPGARILIRLDNTSAYALLFFGAIAGGFVPLPTSTQLTDPEVRFLLQDSGAEAIALADDLPLHDLPGGLRVFTADEIARMLRESPRADYADTAADDPAFLIYTSGTTASPKGVLHSQRAAFGRRPMYRGWYGIGADDRMLHAGAFNWTFTLGTGLTDPWANGATSIIYTGEKDPALWPRLIAETGATLFAGVPGVYRQMLKYANPSPSDLGALRHGLMAGESPPSRLFDEWEQRTGRPLYEALGMSEISTYVSSGPETPRRDGAVGRAQPGRRIAILPIEGGDTPLRPGEEGMLAVHRSDPGLMLGYWKRPEEEAQVYRGEWFIGGDLATIDADGYVFHQGRANDLMKALGYRVSPLEVEAVLAQHPAIAEVACAEARVRADVSVIAAFVVLHPGAPQDSAQIESFAAERLAGYKRPRAIVFVDALPRTANGKIKRSALHLPQVSPAT
ncbi:class I adenylate-forming enzyme family protein [Hyphomicrobium sp. NDB2Meth4]|uniref:class I adenylate-forming enzyme family protein n=1 Tax=Hyphomicrobium sp. NDB2Meth4 TaxID=1892846 RepID=UPI000931E7F6|nr:class I adenylate-forming enzyme family protein [Hyphomicrobium sp. NDB2Meth4]